MLNINDYIAPLSAWKGIVQYAKDHPDLYGGILPDSVPEDNLLKVIKKEAKSVLAPKEYDTFRKALTSLRKGKAVSIKKENIFRLLFVLKLDSDTAAQDLLMNYLHQSELSARSLDEFIIIAALKLRLSWEETSGIRSDYSAQIMSQPVSPSDIKEGQTAEVYYSIIREKINSIDKLRDFLDQPENLTFFAKTCNTQYLALFDDVQLEFIYNGSKDQQIHMYTNYGLLERETIRDYYYALYGLSEKEILALADIYEDVFMSYDNFCLLVQRKRPVNISSGLFLLSLFKKLLTSEKDSREDFYVDFLDSEELIEVINDILIYFGFPVMNPDLDPFERLILDCYHECLDQNSTLSNSEFQQTFIDRLWYYLRELAHASLTF